MRSTDGHLHDLELLTKMVSMSQVRINELTAGYLLVLKEELCDLVVGYRATPEHKDKFSKQLTTENITAIQSLFRSWLEAIIIEGKQSLSWTINVPMKLVMESTSHNRSEPFENSVISSDPIDKAAVSLFLLIRRNNIAPNRFRKCPECGVLFFLSRKPDERTFYCSTKCASRAATRNYREGNAKKPTRLKHPKRSNSRNPVSSESGKNPLLRKPKRAIELD